MYPVHPFPFSTELEGAHPLRFCQRAGSYDRTATSLPVVSAALIAPAHHAALQASMDRRFSVPSKAPQPNDLVTTRSAREHSRLRVLRAASECPTRRLGVWLFLTHLSRTSCPREPASFADEGSGTLAFRSNVPFLFATLLDALHQPLAARRQHVLTSHGLPHVTLTLLDMRILDRYIVREVV